MVPKIYLGPIVLAAFLSMSIIPGMGCSTPPQASPPPATDYMKGAVGTPDELSPIAPAEARNIRKIGNRWTCEVHGQVMIYNAGTDRWEPGKK